MTNFTEQRQPTTTQDFCEADELEEFHYIVLASVNIFLSVAATLGNVLIVFAASAVQALTSLPCNYRSLRWFDISPDVCRTVAIQDVRSAKFVLAL